MFFSKIIAFFFRKHQKIKIKNKNHTDCINLSCECNTLKTWNPQFRNYTNFKDQNEIYKILNHNLKEHVKCLNKCEFLNITDISKNDLDLTVYKDVNNLNVNNVNIEKLFIKSSLEVLNCVNCVIRTICHPLSVNSNLFYLQLYKTTYLENLDLSNFKVLEILKLYYVNINCLIVPNNNNIKTVILQDFKFIKKNTNLDFSNFNSLIQLKLKNINVKNIIFNNKSVKYISCNFIKSILDFSKCESLKTINIKKTNVDLLFNKNIENIILTSYSCYFLNISKCKKLTSLILNHCLIEKVESILNSNNLHSITSLNELDSCLTELNISNSLLRHLNLIGTKCLEKIKLNKSLEYLDLSHSNIKKIDFSYNTRLKILKLKCVNCLKKLEINRVKYIELECQNLISLKLDNSYLEHNLCLSKCPNLKKLYLFQMINLEIIDFKINTLLEKICIYEGTIDIVNLFIPPSSRKIFYMNLSNVHINNIKIIAHTNCILKLGKVSESIDVKSKTNNIIVKLSHLPPPNIRLLGCLYDKLFIENIKLDILNLSTFNTIRFISLSNFDVKNIKTPLSLNYLNLNILEKSKSFELNLDNNLLDQMIITISNLDNLKLMSRNNIKEVILNFVYIGLLDLSKLDFTHVMLVNGSIEKIYLNTDIDQFICEMNNEQDLKFFSLQNLKYPIVYLNTNGKDLSTYFISFNFKKRLLLIDKKIKNYVIINDKDMVVQYI
jgi:hypothetical protein